MSKPAPRRNLPTPIIDLIRDGVSKKDLRGGANKAVWSALVRTAMSAQQRGWNYADWAYLISETRSNLGRQARLDRGRTDIGARRYEKVLQNAWERANETVANNPAITAEDARETIRPLMRALRNLAEDRWPLGEVDRAVLAFALAEGERRGTTRPVLPRRAVATHLRSVFDIWDDLNSELAEDRSSGVVKRSLERLTREGWIDLHDRGRPTATGSAAALRANAGKEPRRAALYGLPTGRLAARLGTSHISVPASGPEGQNAQTCGTAGSDAPGRLHRPVGQTDRKEQPMITIRLDPGGRITAEVPDSPGALAEVLETLRASGLEVHTNDETPSAKHTTKGVDDLAERRAAARGAR